MEAELALRHEREIQEGDAFFLPESRFQRTGLAHPLRGPGQQCFHRILGRRGDGTQDDQQKEEDCSHGSRSSGMKILS